MQDKSVLHLSRQQNSRPSQPFKASDNYLLAFCNLRYIHSAHTKCIFYFRILPTETPKFL